MSKQCPIAVGFVQLATAAIGASKWRHYRLLRHVRHERWIEYYEPCKFTFTIFDVMLKIVLVSGTNSGNFVQSNDESNVQAIRSCSNEERNWALERCCARVDGESRYVDALGLEGAGLQQKCGVQDYTHWRIFDRFSR